MLTGACINYLSFKTSYRSHKYKEGRKPPSSPISMNSFVGENFLQQHTQVTFHDNSAYSADQEWEVYITMTANILTPLTFV